MCKANKNTIRITEPVAELRQKVHTLASWKQYFKRDADALADFKRSPSSFVLGENYLPFVDLNLFGSDQITKTKDVIFRIFQNGRNLKKSSSEFSMHSSIL